jgi:ABC-type Fe3+ transport system substrate-binding protein
MTNARAPNHAIAKSDRFSFVDQTSKPFVGIIFSCLLLLSHAAKADDQWLEGAGPAWADMLAKAKTEKPVVVAIGAPIANELASAFKRDTGLDLQHIGGDASAVSARLAQEIVSPNLTIDVQIGGSSELPFIERGLMQPIKPLLVLPRVTEGKYWLGGKIRWIDNAGQYYAQGAEYVSFRVFANPDKINVSEIREFADLLKPQYKGKIASSDPSGAAGGRGFAEAVASSRGQDFLVKLYKGQDITFTRNPTQLVEWAARGVQPIIIGSLQQYVDKFVSEGFNIKYVTFSDWPVHTTGGRSVIKVPAKAPHPNAAAVFVNWFLSKPGQELYEKLLAEPSRRIDLAHANIPDYAIPKPGIDYVGSYDESYVLKLRGEVAKQMRAIVNE